MADLQKGEKLVVSTYPFENLIIKLTDMQIPITLFGELCKTLHSYNMSF